MTEGVKRAYGGSRRRASAEQTRRRIVEAAASLFLDRGYAATSIDAIAQAAAVSPATVYKVFGNKVAVVKAVGDAAAAGDHGPEPTADREWVRAAFSDPDPERALEAFVRGGVAILQRVAPVIEMVTAAAHVEPELVSLAEGGDRGRRQNFRLFVSRLHERGQLRPGLTVEDATDAIYALQSPETYLALVRRRGWTVEHLIEWLIDQLGHAILPAPRPGRAKGATTQPGHFR
jgi:AcrR family transcriptional regulator